MNDSPARTIALKLTREEFAMLSQLIAKELDRGDLLRRVYAAWDAGMETNA